MANVTNNMDNRYQTKDKLSQLDHDKVMDRYSQGTRSGNGTTNSVGGLPQRNGGMNMSNC